jgi:hypothetical protein
MKFGNFARSQRGLIQWIAWIAHENRHPTLNPFHDLGLEI